jgi:peptidyl-prolyl cis-trans isomerase C
VRQTLINTLGENTAKEAFSGCSVGPKPAARRAFNAPPIVVNGVEVPEAAIAQEAQNHRAASAVEARAAAARALAIRELLLQRARALGLAPEPLSDEAGREETPDESLVRQVLEREVAPAEPSEAECRRAHAAAPRFGAPELYEASHILVAPEGEEETAWSAARASAAALIAALREGGASFAELAGTRSACPSAGQGGSLGQLQRGDLAAEVESALAPLKAGEVGPAPVRTHHGWHVVRLDRRIPAAPLPFEAVAPAIRETLRARAWAAAATRYVAQLARDADIQGIDLTIAPAASP